MCKIKIEKLDWDTSFLGFPVGRLDLTNCRVSNMSPILEKYVSEAKTMGYKLIYLFSNELIALDNNLFKTALLADEKIVYNKKVPTETKKIAREELLIPIQSYYKKEVTSSLLNIAYESGKYSRFKTDSNFSESVFQQMYSIWLERSISGEIADDVLVYKEGDKILGLLTYTIRTDKTCVIGLIGVDPQAQRKRIGSKLLSSLESQLRLHNISNIEVATQNKNVKACSFYEKNKYQIKNITNIYHIWL
ncbi:MAG: GNAT family N-acetyltransferase [Bacteroidaceae bacterium]|nr:GNAT family N-acetyltransferase [Bacteroidaceae bacterium]